MVAWSQRQIIGPTYFLHLEMVGWSRLHVGRDNTHISGQAADAYTRNHMAASEGSLGGAGSISAAPEGPDERSPDS